MFKINGNNPYSDEYYTPINVVKLIMPYLKPNSNILCPFDKVESNFVKILVGGGVIILLILILIKIKISLIILKMKLKNLIILLVIHLFLKKVKLLKNFMNLKNLLPLFYLYKLV